MALRATEGDEEGWRAGFSLAPRAGLKSRAD
jgi:hypothetical protein